MTRILVIEDEENLLQALKYNLEQQGHEVMTASDGGEGLDLVKSSRPDAVILDLMLPVMDGLEVCRLVRRESDVPIIMLTAKSEEIDRIVGLEVGADDYVTKPFSMRELVARVKAILRRPRAAPAPDGDPVETLKVGSLEVDVSAHRARLAGKELELKPKEFDLLVLFMSHRGRAFTRNDILERLWGHDYFGDTRTVDVHIRWLREKVEADPSNPVRIITIRGVGYRFEG